MMSEKRFKQMEKQGKGKEENSDIITQVKKNKIKRNWEYESHF